MMAELGTLAVEHQKVAEDDLAREQFKEEVLALDSKHEHVHSVIAAWSTEKTVFLSKKEEIGSIADAELQLSLLNAYLTERKELEAVRVPPLQELGQEILAKKYKTDYSQWKLPDEDVTALNGRETEVLGYFPVLDTMSTVTLAVLEDDLARENFREKLRLENVAHTDMHTALLKWVEVSKTYLAVKEACGSIPDAVSNLSTLASYHGEKSNHSGGAVPALKALGERISNAKYETELSSYVFPTPDEVKTREGGVDEAWTALDAASVSKQAVLDDDLARELFKEKLRQDNEQHKAKHAKLDSWISKGKTYLAARDEVTSVTMAQENLNTLRAFAAEKVDTTNGDVAAFNKLGDAITAAEYKTDLSSYKFESPGEIAERRALVEKSWVEMAELYTTKAALAEDDLKREEHKEKLRQSNEQHKKKQAGLVEWVGEKKAYLETKEEVASVTDAQNNLATWSAYEEEKQITTVGAFAGLKQLGQEIINDKYESALSSYSFPTPDEITGREGDIGASLEMLDGLSKTKQAVLEDDLAREEFKQKLRGFNTTHTNDHSLLKAWVAAKTEYLKKKEAVDSISDANQNLEALKAYNTEKEYTTKGAVASMKKLGNDILTDEYKTSLSTWKWETPDEITQREGEIDTDWSELDTLCATKTAILEDDLAREMFRERLRLDNENHKSKHAWVEVYSTTSDAYLKKTEEVDSIADASSNLANLNSFEADKVDVTSFNVASLKNLGQAIITAKYETELSSFVFATPQEITDREGDVDTKWVSLTELSAAKKEVLDADTAREEKKEALRISFADKASDMSRWTQDRDQDATTTTFGFTLSEVEAFKATLDAEDATVSATGDDKVSAAKATYSEMTAMDVDENDYTTATPASLDETLAMVTAEILQARQTRYSVELERHQANNKLCKDFAALVEPFVKKVEDTKASVAAGGDLEAQSKLIEGKLAEDDAAVVAMETLQGAMDTAGITLNIHSALTALDARLMWKSYLNFLGVKKKNIDEEIQHNKMRGMTQEQFDEIEKMFKQFDKSGNGFLDKSEFKACLYSLGEERGSKETLEIMKQHSADEEQGIGYEGFVEFMIKQLGDTDTQEEILLAFALINGDISPLNKKRDQMTEEEKVELEEKMEALTKVCGKAPMLKVMQEDEVEYLLSTHTADGGMKYDTWTEEVFAR